MYRRLQRRREMRSSLNDDTFTSVMIAVMSVGVIIIYYLLGWIYSSSVWMMNK